MKRCSVCGKPVGGAAVVAYGKWSHADCYWGATDDRPVLYISTDHNPDDVRCFYELPQAVTDLIQPTGDRRTFVQCLADMLTQQEEAS